MIKTKPSENCTLCSCSLKCSVFVVTVVPRIGIAGTVILKGSFLGAQITQMLHFLPSQAAMFLVCSWKEQTGTQSRAALSRASLVFRWWSCPSSRSSPQKHTDSDSRYGSLPSFCCHSSQALPSLPSSWILSLPLPYEAPGLTLLLTLPIITVFLFQGD